MDIAIREQRAERIRIFRMDINRKHNLLVDLGFKFEGTRYKHPSGKIITMDAYNRMNYAALVNRLTILGFAIDAIHKSNSR